VSDLSGFDEEEGVAGKDVSRTRPIRVARTARRLFRCHATRAMYTMAGISLR